MTRSELLSSEFFIQKCDYNFGVLTSNRWLVKEASDSNIEFARLVESFIEKGELVMKLFIDNVRLYQRKYIRFVNMENPEIFLSDDLPTDLNVNAINGHNRSLRVQQAQKYRHHDLLNLCRNFPQMKFIIFTGLEDISLDEEVFEHIPDNVIKIFAANAGVFGGKVLPIPFGLALLFNKDALLDLMNDQIDPDNLMYINHSLGSNPERYRINKSYKDFSWVTIESPIDHSYQSCFNYLKSIKKHKFMICADGNAINCDCYRNWEVLYMRRVPIVKDSSLFRYIFKDLPVLFVDSFFDITEELLLENEHLYLQAKNIDMNLLNCQILYDNLLKNIYNQ